MATLPRLLLAYITLVGGPETARQIDAKARQQTATGAAWWSLTLGTDLEGMRQAVGCQRNVAVMGIAATNGQPISFWTFTKYGLVVAPAPWPSHGLRRLAGFGPA